MSVIDEKEPLEAVHKETGRVVPMTFKEWHCGTHNGKRHFATFECPDSKTSNYDWYDDGGDVCEHNKWFIRNVQAAPALPADWAIQAAIDRAKGQFIDGKPWTIPIIVAHNSTAPYARLTVELARMIEKHEEAPDPLAEDREFVADMWVHCGWNTSAKDIRKGQYDDIVRKAMSFLRANVDKITRSA
jgi:hypothetical protein